MSSTIAGLRLFLGDQLYQLRAQVAARDAGHRRQVAVVLAGVVVVAHRLDELAGADGAGRAQLRQPRGGRPTPT